MWASFTAQPLLPANVRAFAIWMATDFASASVPYCKVLLRAKIAAVFGLRRGSTDCRSWWLSIVRGLDIERSPLEKTNLSFDCPGDGKPASPSKEDRRRPPYALSLRLSMIATASSRPMQDRTRSRQELTHSFTVDDRQGKDLREQRDEVSEQGVTLRGGRPMPETAEHLGLRRAIRPDGRVPRVLAIGPHHQRHQVACASG